MMDIQLREVIQFLEEQGYDCIPIDKRNGEYVDIDIITNICGEEMRLRCKFPKSFPYSFPRIYILEVFYKSIAPLPHIDNSGYICTFDSNMAFPNHKEPTKLVEESIKKAIKIIEEGISGTNKEDFVEEFTSYWGLESDTRILALFTPDNNPRLLYLYLDKDNGYYVTDDMPQLKEYLLYSKKINIDEKNIMKALYIPLQKSWYPPYPKTNKEIFLNVREERKSFKAYHRYLKDRTDMSIIIFSQEIENEKYLAGWIHKPVKSPKNFRKDRISPEFAYLMQYKNEEIIKLDVSQIDRRRLFNRGGDGNIVSNCKVSVSGCGSIGSFLIQVLGELGIDDFTLIDNDILSSENIARHICGASDIGKRKTEAIKEQLIRHYPYMKCKSIPNDVFDVLHKDIDIFNECDINFVVVGNKPIEMRFLELFNNEEVIKPIIIIWVEPFLLGGHAIIMQNKQDIESIIYDLKYKFKYGIVADGGKYTKKEAGCQSTFIPYSAFEAKQFIYSFMDFFYNNYMLRETEGNYLFSWCGNLKWARKNDIMISDGWLSKQNRTVSIQRLDNNDKI